MKELLKVRNAAKARKPRFLKQDAHAIPSLKKNWRAPRGTHSRIRRRFKSYRLQPSPGFGSPKEVRGLSRDGFEQVVVHNLNDLSTVKDACIISGTVGMRNKIVLLKKAKELKLVVLNVKDIDAALTSAEAILKKRKEQVKSREAKKKKSKEESLKLAKEKEAKEKKEASEEKSTEDKEKEAKEEKRKVLETQK
tara:strand:+ start:33641 stop:34222 length:582 start_codon:yes stop_codon:yes gene_type:complete